MAVLLIAAPHVRPIGSVTTATTAVHAAVRLVGAALPGTPTPRPVLTLDPNPATLTLNPNPGTLTLTTTQPILELHMLTLTQNDTAPRLSGRVNVSLVDAVVEVHLVAPGDVVTVAPATVTDDSGGEWSYQWADGDLDPTGVWLAAVQVTFVDGRVQTFGPERFMVRREYA